jgi:hypothetical protein
LTLVLRLNQKTHAPHLYVHDADRTRRHPTSQPPDHRVPDMCDHPRSSAPGLLLLPWSSSQHVMPHLPPTHHKISKRDSPNERKVKEKENKTILDSNSKLAKSMTHHNQIKELTTWFLMNHSNTLLTPCNTCFSLISSCWTYGYSLQGRGLNQDRSLCVHCS